jgi:LuxR family transcriptional regulator, quorum-sensing system regulator CciR
MGRFRDVQTFVRAARESSTLDDLARLVGDASRTMGFEYYSFGHHVNLVGSSLIQVSNYPDAWRDTIKEKRYIVDDPVVVACQTSAAGFRWSQIDSLITLSSRQSEILRGASDAGMGDGFTVPIHLPGECAGSCSFAVARNRELHESSLPAAQYIGSFAFEAVRRLAREVPPRGHMGDGGPAPVLTSRQLDCVVLVARGKSDGDAAQLLGISADTVHQHIETAKQRFGVATRMQLVIRTLFDNQLTFRDIIRR